MAARPQTTIRDKDLFGPRNGAGNWQKLKDFVDHIDPKKFTIPQNPKSQLVADANFRLDMQGRFTYNKVEYYNLQVQQGANTVFAVYVQVTGYTSGKITSNNVIYRIQQSAYHKTEHTTMYLDKAGSVQFQQLRPQDFAIPAKI